jgi:endogenous inhibitor of DNA gyrase (YacG/DUF329 family)
MTSDVPLRKTARCPQCGQNFTFSPADEPSHLPFCSFRCQWIDLSRWLDGGYRVSRPIEQQDVEKQD